MKKAYILIVIPLFVGCLKGDDFCEKPVDLTSMVVESENNNPANPVKVKINYVPNYGDDHKNDLFSFSVPSVFINPKGNDRPTDVIDQNSVNIEYSYQLKDPSNPPAAVEVEAYLFNDCGKSNTVKAVITYDTTSI